MVRTIYYGGGKLAVSIQNLRIVVIIVTYKVAGNVVAMTPARQNMCLGDWTASSKEHWILQQAIPKGYATAFKMCTPRLVSKLNGDHGYYQFRVNQDVVGLFSVIRSSCCEYNRKFQDTYAITQAKKRVTLLWKPKDHINNDYKKVFEALIDVVEMYVGNI